MILDCECYDTKYDTWFKIGKLPTKEQVILINLFVARDNLLLGFPMCPAFGNQVIFMLDLEN